MSSPTGPAADPQANIKTERIPVRVGPGDLKALQDAMKIAVEDVVQRRDIEELEVGDKMVSQRSGTVREIIKKIGLTNFICLTTKTYQ